MKSKGFVDQAIFVTFLVVIACLFLAAVYPFRQAGAQSLDVWTRGAWMIAHASDEASFPPGAELCAAPFCTRANTDDKYVGGNRGRRSETSLPFCPGHTPGLPKTESRYDDGIRFIYWILAMALSGIEGGLVFFAAVSPLTLITRIAGKAGRPAWVRRLGSGADSLAVLLGLAAMLAWVAAWVAFAWW